MRPLRIRMQAFGAYAGVQALDFSELGGHDFFLITGPTGSGKTTVLDAMAFALYGETSGGEREARDMRSQYAAPDLLTEVEFEFAVGSECYRIVRSPQQERPRKRGDGTTTHLQAATVWRLATSVDGVPAPDRPLADGWTDVTRAAEGILGFRSQQFRQVVMLPQGRFQELLKAKSQDKEKILSALFDTAFYARIELALKARAAALTRDHERLAIERQTICEQVGVADAAELATQRAAAAVERDAADAAAVHRSDEQAAAQQTLSEAEAVAGRLGDLERARELRASLAANAERTGHLRAELELARLAAPLAADDEAVGERVREAEAHKGDLTAARERLAARETEKADADAGLATEEARAPARENAAAQERRLRDLAPTVEGVGALAGEVRQAEERRDDAVAGEERAKAAATRADETRAAAAQRLQDARAAAAGADALASVADQAAATARLRRDAETVAARLEEAEAAVADLARLAGDADARYRAAVDHLRTLEDDWQAGQAARLAASLQEGVPCPVCGATEHPAPASPGSGPAPGDDELGASRDVLDRLFAERDASQRDLAAAQRRHQQALAEREQLGRTLGEAATFTPEQCDERARAAAAESAAAAAARAALPAIEADDRDARDASDEARARAQAAEAASVELRSATAALAAALAERRRGVPSELADPVLLAAALVTAEHERRALDETLTAAREAAQAAAIALETARTEEHHAGTLFDGALQASRRAAERFAARLKEQGFAEAPAWRAALRVPAQIEALATAVRDYDDQVVAADATLTQAELAASGLSAPDLDALRAAATAARKRADEAAAARASVEARLASLDRARGELDRIDRASAAIDEEYAVTGRIAQVATGDNPLKLNFQRFVLGVHLDRVLEIATQRLRSMTSKRFDLERSDETQGRSRTAGLDLEVFDAWTGETRPVSTLSGGESFMAALALALGLAQAVQEYSGGIRLDTIFVDEGFGSLDAEALDHALSTLTTLQENGRLVGIISHLAEVKERVEARLEVTLARTGSQARFVVP